MKYVLDLKDYVTKLNSEEKDYNETFYRYYVLDCNDEKNSNSLVFTERR